MKKTGRNDPCPCGSGKKFKKCCESKMIGGRYKATKIDASNSPQVASASRLTGLFQSRVSIAQPSEESQSLRDRLNGPKKEDAEENAPSNSADPELNQEKKEKEVEGKDEN